MLDQLLFSYVNWQGCQEGRGGCNTCGWTGGLEVVNPHDPKEMGLLI